jgi:hypothetical protein
MLGVYGALGYRLIFRLPAGDWAAACGERLRIPSLLEGPESAVPA